MSDLSSILDKKVGDFNKKESKSLDFTGLKIPRDYYLTKEGRKVAEKIYERHKFFKEQLISAGVSPNIAETEACRIEHCISDESFLKLKEHREKGKG